ncbi:MAG: hypothetical protein ACT4RN_09045 [Pseudonocardia sp.]
MPSRHQYLAATLGALAVVGVTATTGIASDEGRNTVRPLQANQTESFFDGQNQVLTYGQNFQCVIDPFDDLDGIGRQGDGIPAAADPDEMVFPSCISGETAGGSEPLQDPTGLPIDKAREFFVIVPLFDADGDGLIEAFDPTPGIDLQCPEPGSPSHSEDQPVGACTTHPSFVASEPILAEAGTEISGLPMPDPFPMFAGLPGKPPVDAPFVVPANPPAVIPLPGHSHITDTEFDDTIWWQVIVTLVTDPAVFPDLEGDCAAGRDKCLTSIDALRASQANGGTGRDIPSNIFLFFANEPLDGAVGVNAPHSGHH